jgi:tripartite-type tricarboxylate transporter receptor subunit TctC
MKSQMKNSVSRYSQPWFRKSATVACCAFIFYVAGQAPAGAEPGFPNKPVRIFLAQGPGGVGDLTMRLLADKLSQRLKQQFVIDNRPGAGGLLSARALLSSPPDGYTLGNIGNATAIGTSLYKTRPYNPLTDFSWVSVTSSFEMLLGVKGDSPIKALQDVVEAAKKNPGKLNFGTISPGTTQNLSAHLLKMTTGLDVEVVPYKTTPELVTAILRKDIDVGFDFFGGFQSAIVDNQIRIIATAGERRRPLLPDVPTAVESGLPDYIVTSWSGLAAPAGLAEDVRNLLNREINTALADSDLQKKANALGMDVRGSSPEEMGARMARDIEKWAGVIEKAGIPKE